MKIFEYTTTLWLPVPRPELFPFFAEARNLEKISPPWLSFSVLTPEPIQMAEGTLIDYRLRWRGIPMRWQSEISVWDPPRLFVDRQVRGPYRMWHHEHRFDDKDGGTEVSDHVRYAVPFGRLANWISVRRDVESIFAHRREQLLTLFGGDNTSV